MPSVTAAERWRHCFRGFLRFNKALWIRRADGSEGDEFLRGLENVKEKKMFYNINFFARKCLADKA